MAADSKTKMHHQILKLTKEGNHKEALRIAKIFCEKYSDDVESHILLGTAYVNNKKYDKARRAVHRGLQKFSREWKLYELLGHIYGHLNRMSEAEAAFTNAIKYCTDDKSDLAEIHYYLGSVLWEQAKRDEAIAQWKRALEIDPGCIEAKEALKDRINEYGEPKAPTPIFDDLYHFHGIQLKRYYALVGRDEFISEEEAKNIIGIIMNGWNEFVSPRSRDIDDMKTEERTAFFKSITLDFTNAVVKWRNRK